MTPETLKKGETRETMLKVLRLALMLIEELIKDEEHREKYFELTDKATEKLKKD